MAVPAFRDDPPETLGRRLAGFRKDRGLTLAQLAEACGFSEATLSRIESGKTAISAHHLLLAAQRLGVDVNEFFRADAPPVARGARALTRAGRGDHEAMARYDTEVLCADLSRKAMHPAINTITARDLDAAGGLSAHAGEEFLHVLEGAITLVTDLYQPTRLTAGDSLYFDSATPHAYLNAGEDPARILVVVGAKAGRP